MANGSWYPVWYIPVDDALYVGTQNHTTKRDAKRYGKGLTEVSNGSPVWIYVTAVKERDDISSLFGHTFFRRQD